ncbi:MAG: hypothetical protein U0796_10125 [Gemmatales bacterium]
MLSMNEDSGNSPAITSIRDSAFRSLRRPEAKGLLESFRKWVHNVEVQSPSGLFLGRRMQVDIDLDRLYRVVARIVRGLYFVETETILSPAAKVEVYSDERINENRREVANEFVANIAVPLAKQPAKVILNGIFSYRYQLTEMPEASGWALVFFGNIPFIVLTLPESAVRSRLSQAELIQTSELAKG